MAMEADAFVKKEYAEKKKAFEQSYDGKIVGVMELNGKIRPAVFSSAEELKLVTGREGYPNLVYAGKINLKDGEYAGLEEVDMSKVKIKSIVLTEKGRKLIDERRKDFEERSRKLNSYSNQIPNETKSMITAIDNNTSYAIMTCLSKKGKQSHNQLKEKLGLDDIFLRKGIERLEIGGLVDEKAPIYFVKNKESKKTTGVHTGSLEETDYELSVLGTDFLKTLESIWKISNKSISKQA
jgi:hypothetical protein